MLEIDVRMTIADFISTTGAKMTADWTDRNPNMPEHDNDMDHWKCVIRVGKKTMTTVFSMGLGHGGKEPKLSDVLDCLAGDASSATDDFADWCRDAGYDTDSRKAERIYKACAKTRAKLERLLGSDGIETLLYNVDH